MNPTCRLRARSNDSMPARAAVDILQALAQLDRQLDRAVDAADAAFGPDAAGDRFRGLHIESGEVQRLLHREPGAPLFDIPADTDGVSHAQSRTISALDALKHAYELSNFDLDILLIALAPEIDTRYERLYAYLQDDVSRRRPRVDLVLNLLCATPESRIASRQYFGASAPLIRHQVVRLIPEADQTETSLLDCSVKVDDQVIRYVLGDRSLDARLADYCEVINPTVSLQDLTLAPELSAQLSELLSEPRLLAYFQGPPVVGKRGAAEGIALCKNVPLLRTDLRRLPSDEHATIRLLELMLREAWFLRALLYLDGVDVLPERTLEMLVELLAVAPADVVASGKRSWPPAVHRASGMKVVTLSLPSAVARRRLWQESLRRLRRELSEEDLATIADRFQLTAVQIDEAAMTARPGIDGVFVAARRQSGHALAALTQKIEARATWQDLVLPDDSLDQLHEICSRVAHRERVLDEWGFGQKLSRGTAANALFSGPSGTGKTMAAEVVASELALDLYRVDLAAVVSKYIGETEKNLDRIFDAAESSNAILLFDEADALFGKRSEVHDSHDRYANVELSYLLQKFEEYDGIAILATNLRQNVDDAFIRRLAFQVAFPFPNEISRYRIWSGIWPAATPLGGDLDLELLARRFKLSGGHIKNAALAAAFLAGAQHSPVSMAHVLHAVRREYQKLGRPLAEVELQPATLVGDSVDGAQL